VLASSCDIQVGVEFLVGSTGRSAGRQYTRLSLGTVPLVGKE
jgi:hypothetical protein